MDEFEGFWRIRNATVYFEQTLRMEKRCPNCHQPLLLEDTACWQCGWQGGEPETMAATTAVTSLATDRGAFAVPASALYTAFTVFLVGLALLLLRQLGQQPLVQVSAGGRMPAGWQRVTTHEQTLTLDLPSGWMWLDQENPQQATDYEALLAQRRALLALTYPLGRVDANASILLAAAPAAEIGPAAPVTLVVIRSPILSQITAEQAILAVQEAGVEVVDARQLPNYDKTHTSFLLEMESEAWGRVRCRQQFFHDEADSLLLAVCGQPAAFRLRAQEIEQILPTVQRLLP